MAKSTLIIVIFLLFVSLSYTSCTCMGNTASLRKNIADLTQGKLNFSDPSLPCYTESLRDMVPKNNSEYDFIVIGAGSAGTTIASRLSENKKTNVLLIEAGIQEYPIMDIPLMAVPLQFSTQINWMYRTESSDKYCLGYTDSRCLWPRGKVMGGSSVLNYMLATRGNRKDFNDWAKLTGDLSWSYDRMLKYFKKLENFIVKGVKVNDKLHNENGPLYIGSAPYASKLTQEFIKANEELGIPLNDYNGQEQSGASYFQSTVADGERWSTNRAYLHPARFRENLFLTINSLVTKILIDEKTHTAYGAQFIKDGKNIQVTARKEIILSAGAINSPQILMLSGIGPATHLNDFGIHVIKDAPVGENLMDHVGYGGLIFKINDSATYTPVNPWAPSDSAINEYLTKRNGSLALGAGFEALSYINVDNENFLSNEPNIEMLFSPTPGILNPLISKAMGVSVEYENEFHADDIKQSMWTIWPMLMSPKSSGKLLLQSKNPNAKPKLYPNYFDHPEDIRILIGGIRAAIRLSDTTVFQQYGSELCETTLPCKKFPFNSDRYWECAIRTFTTTIFHYCGTCKMGKETDKSAVVNSKLEVIGIKRLRVIDASIMPKIASAHIHIPVVAIAEKLSDEIKQKWNIT